MGGAEVFTHEVAKRWVESGHEVTLFTSQFQGGKKEEFADGVTIVRAGGKYSVYRQAKKLYAERFEAEKFDVIIDEINTVPFFAPKFAKNKEKVVALIHQLAREYWFYEMPFPISYLGHHFFEDRWLKQYVDVLTITVSESTSKDLADLGFRHVFVVPEGLNFESLKDLPTKDSKPIVIFSGRLKRAKRPDHAVEAFKIVKAHLPASEMWVFGDGPFRLAVERNSGLGVKFFGNLDNVERRELMKKGWVLVVPGVREGWGLNVIEANALGVPAVAYDVPGLRDSVINLKTGLLAESGNIGDLADKTLKLLGDSSLRERLSKNALIYSKQFSWDKTADEFLKRITQ